MRIRTQLKAGGLSGTNHNETLRVRTALKAGGLAGNNHNETLQVRTALKAGGLAGTNHNEKLSRATDRPAVSMRRQPLTTSRKEDRLELLVVRAGLKAGRRSRERWGR